MTVLQVPEDRNDAGVRRNGVSAGLDVVRIVHGTGQGIEGCQAHVRSERLQLDLHRVLGIIIVNIDILGTVAGREICYVAVVDGSQQTEQAKYRSQQIISWVYLFHFYVIKKSCAKLQQFMLIFFD